MIDRVKRFLKVNEDHGSVFSIIYVDVPIICIIQEGRNDRV